MPSGNRHNCIWNGLRFTKCSKSNIHWGPSSDVESYVQETGRVGHNGEFVLAILYFAKEELSKARHVTDDMISYVKNEDKCRKEVLFSSFDQTVLYQLHQNVHAVTSVKLFVIVLNAVDD